jgi:hypothetical protein
MPKNNYKDEWNASIELVAAKEREIEDLKEKIKKNKIVKEPIAKRFGRFFKMIFAWFKKFLSKFLGWPLVIIIIAGFIFGPIRCNCAHDSCVDDKCLEVCKKFMNSPSATGDSVYRGCGEYGCLHGGCKDYSLQLCKCKLLKNKGRYESIKVIEEGTFSKKRFFSECYKENGCPIYPPIFGE